jgi:hypothetical protein
LAQAAQVQQVQAPTVRTGPILSLALLHQPAGVAGLLLVPALAQMVALVAAVLGMVRGPGDQELLDKVFLVVLVMLLALTVAVVALER